MDLVTLMKRWAELEPARCNMVSGMYAIRGWAVSFSFDASDRLSQAEIQGAVQEAIEEQGWTWALSSLTVHGEPTFSAQITCYSSSDEPPIAYEVQGDKHSAAMILLQAYLNALSDVHLVPA